MTSVKVLLSVLLSAWLVYSTKRVNKEHSDSAGTSDIHPPNPYTGIGLIKLKFNLPLNNNIISYPTENGSNSEGFSSSTLIIVIQFHRAKVCMK